MELTARRRRAHLTLAAVVFLAALVAAALYRFPPDQYGFYPTCPFHGLTGWLCPGCGATRALAALTHGNLLQALRLNGLVVALLPILAVHGLLAYRRALIGDETVWPPVPQRMIAAALVLAGIFMVARNLV